MSIWIKNQENYILSEQDIPEIIFIDNESLIEYTNLIFKHLSPKNNTYYTLYIIHKGNLPYLSKKLYPEDNLYIYNSVEEFNTLLDFFIKHKELYKK